MSKRKTIYSALPIVAASYGEKFGVKVNIGGDSAYTDGESIQIPNIPESYPHMDAVWGYLAHEAAHVKFTDFSVERRRGLHASLSNVIEDCRIEMAMINELPGTATTLNEVACHMAHAGHYRHATPDAHPASIVQGYCLYWLQSQVVGQTVLNPYLESAQQAMKAVLPAGVNVRLQALLRKAIGITSTEQACRLASDIIKMIEEEQEKEAEQDKQQSSPEQQDQSQDGDQGDSANKGEEQGQGSQRGDSGQSQGGQDGYSQAEGDAGAGQAEKTQNDGANQSSANGQQAGGDDNDSASKVLQQILSAGEGDLMDDAKSKFAAEMEGESSYGDCHYQTIKKPDLAENSPLGRGLLKEVQGTTAKIRSQLYGLVQASQKSTTRTRRSGRKLDANRLHRVANGDSRVFKQRAKRQRPNAAVHVLVDMSGSMQIPVNRGDSSSPAVEDVARKASLALALALEAIPGVNPAVTYFKGTAAKPVYSIVRHGQKVQPNVGRFFSGCKGTTPMAEGIWHAAYELIKTREERKLIIVITDGAPDNRAATASIIDLCENSDFEVFGIGIGKTPVDQLFSRNTSIERPEDLQRTLFKLMERTLALDVA